MSITPIPTTMKMEVLDRDGWNCLCCGRPMHRYPDSRVRPDTLSFDHKLPEKFGGPTTVDNLQVLCMACNLHKGVDTLDLRKAAEDYRREYVPALAEARALGYRRLRALTPYRLGPILWTPSLLTSFFYEGREEYMPANFDVKKYRWYQLKRETPIMPPCPIRDAELSKSTWDKRMAYSREQRARLERGWAQIDAAMAEKMIVRSGIGSDSFLPSSLPERLRSS